MDKSIFISLAASSADSLLDFSHFVQQAERYCGISNPFLAEADVRKYDDIWFEMEIVNADALSDWEDEGRPMEWSDKWNIGYRPYAIELIAKLTALLEKG